MLGSSIYKKNRSKLVKNLPKNALCVFESNDQMPTNADGLMPFRQNNDLLYLTGIDQEETSLIIFPDSKSDECKEILFIKKTSKDIAVWEGKKLSVKEAQDISGIRTVLWNDGYLNTLFDLIGQSGCVFLSSNEHPRANVIVESRNQRLANVLKNKFSATKFDKSAPIMHNLRSVKEAEEINIIKHACSITKSGFDRILKFIKPGINEYNIQAELIHEFINRESKGFAYEPIIASGLSACILHYTNNNKVLNEGDVILMDFGAEFKNYASDLTRCVPVSGRFTKRQRDVYNSVLSVMRGAKKLLQPGVYLHEYEKIVGSLMEEELVNLGLISMQEIKNQGKHPAYKKYFMHGTSHHLGLDVHDVSSAKAPLVEGMVLTCEPGIYIPEENLGIRLENDVLISKNDPIDLMGDVQIEAEEIEDLMNS
tara:strand:- start:1255 stop:2529 length:1275 start_codon:yes stop_codon:yes gene_type:complete